MNCGSDEVGKPSGRTASAILGPMLDVSLAVKMALSGDELANVKREVGELTNSKANGASQRPYTDHETAGCGD